MLHLADFVDDGELQVGKRSLDVAELGETVRITIDNPAQAQASIMMSAARRE